MCLPLARADGQFCQSNRPRRGELLRYKVSIANAQLLTIPASSRPPVQPPSLDDLFAKPPISNAPPMPHRGDSANRPFGSATGSAVPLPNAPNSPIDRYVTDSRQPRGTGEHGQCPNVLTILGSHSGNYPGQPGHHQQYPASRYRGEHWPMSRVLTILEYYPEHLPPVHPGYYQQDQQDYMYRGEHDQCLLY